MLNTYFLLHNKKENGGLRKVPLIPRRQTIEWTESESELKKKKKKKLNIGEAPSVTGGQKHCPTNNPFLKMAKLF